MLSESDGPEITLILCERLMLKQAMAAQVGPNMSDLLIALLLVVD